MPGFSVHQYARHQYLARLERAGVTIVSGRELDSAAPGEVRSRSIFDPEREVAFPADAVVLSIGRVPDDALARQLHALGIPHLTAGDCRSPRGLEEAILEGTLAARGDRVAAATR